MIILHAGIVHKVVEQARPSRAWLTLYILLVCNLPSNIASFPNLLFAIYSLQLFYQGGLDHILHRYQISSFQPHRACLNIYLTPDNNILKCTETSKDFSHEAFDNFSWKGFIVERKSLIPPSMHRIERWRGFCLESLSAIPCQLWCPVMSRWVASRDLSKVLLWTPIIAKLAHGFPSSALGPLYKRNSRHQKASLVIMITGLISSLKWLKSRNSNDHILRINEKWWYK